MPIFGQVWLWSSLAFLLGAFLCWALVARPARRRVSELEDELVGRHRRQSMPESARHRALDDEYDEYEAKRGDRRGDQRAAQPSLLPEMEEPPEPLTRAYALPTRAPGESARPGALRSPFDGIGAAPEVDRTDTELADSPETTQYLPFSPGSLGIGKLDAPPEVPSQPSGRGWFDSEAEQRGEPLEAITRLQSVSPGELDRRLVDDEADAPPPSRSGGTIFTQHTHPIPADMIRQIDEAGKEARTDEPADALVDDLADEDTGSRAEQTFGSVPAATPSASLPGIAPGPEVTSQPMPDAEPMAPAHGAQGQTEVMPAAILDSPAEVEPASGQVSGTDTSRRGTDESTIMPGVTARPEPASSGSALPKRVPGKPRGHTPFGVQTKSLSEPADTAEPAAEPARALFEPIVPAEDNPVVPPPHRVRGDGNGRGPFGPGSAMPLPDGASPSPEFTIKASVSAARYCTPDSPQFGRTVAEVWFKSPADAERVGFRPVS